MMTGKIDRDFTSSRRGVPASPGSCYDADMNITVTIGLERAATEIPADLRHARIGLLSHQASVDGGLRDAAEVLATTTGLQLHALFSPQHGFWGEEQANMVETPHGRHPRFPTLPLYSLYSETRRPTPAMLEGLEALVIDLSDVGTRVYTYAWTVVHCLEACAERGLPVVLLDRPNPLGGLVTEGPLLESGYESFVGRLAIPMRHGLTLGELARMANSELGIGAALHVVPVAGWPRAALWEDLGRPWVPPSPNLPTFRSALVYPGQVLLEGTNLSEGRGTTTPFEVVGAPFVDPYRLADMLQEQALSGVTFRPLRFRPTFDKWAGISCGGVMLHVTEPRDFRPYRTTLVILAAVKSLWPREFAWRPPPYEYERERWPIDILSGSSRLREWLDGLHAFEPPPVSVADVPGGESWNQRVQRLSV